MLIVTYFHPIIGPDILMTIPENLETTLGEEIIDDIRALIDNAEEGFFTHSFHNEEIRTVNYYFTLESPWFDRGKEEMILLTKIIQEREPNYAAYEANFKDFVENIKKEIPDLYKAFYIKEIPSTLQNNDQFKEIDEKYKSFKEKLKDLYNDLSLIYIRTFGAMIPSQFLREQRILQIPDQILNELLDDLKKRKNNDDNSKAKTSNTNIFSVYQFKDHKIKIEIIPVTAKVIYKITLFFETEALTPDTISQIGKKFGMFDLELVYTSGICMQGGDCIYEVYIHPKSQKKNLDLDQLKSELSKIDKVKNIKILTIK
ncbi:MAG: hypothetical protein ACTSU2_01445 [Promethearchaeota archaeon]